MGGNSLTFSAHKQDGKVQQGNPKRLRPRWGPGGKWADRLRKASERGFWKVTGLMEKPAQGTASRLAPEIWPALETTERGRGGEIQLTDAMVLCCCQNTTFIAVLWPVARHRFQELLFSPSFRFI